MYDIRNIFNENKNASYINERFKKEFTDAFEKIPVLDRINREVVLENIHNIFRRWYYSTFESNTILSPSNIVNSITSMLVEGVTICPNIKPQISKDRIANLTQDIFFYSPDDHPVVHDMDTILKIFNQEYGYDEEVILPDNLIIDILNKISIADLSYLYFLINVAIHMKVLNIIKKQEMTFVILDDKSEYFKLDNRKKLKLIVNGAIKNSNKNLSDAWPMPNNPFTEKKIREYLRSSRNIEDLFDDMFNSVGYSVSNVSQLVDISPEELSEAEQILVSAYFILGALFDFHFTTPFGYYLKLIQPIYLCEYDIDLEVAEIAKSYNDTFTLDTLLFSSPDGYDITDLGKIMLNIEETKQYQIMPSSIIKELLKDSNSISDILSSINRFGIQGFKELQYRININMEKKDNVIYLFGYNDESKI